MATRQQISILQAAQLVDTRPAGAFLPSQDLDIREKTLDWVEATVLAIPAGPSGAQGSQGIQGVPGPVGPAGLEWQGAWAAATSYAVDDAVGYNGASYFCVTAITGNASNTNPATDTTHWALLAAQGAPGQTGAQGATGPQGPAGLGGSNLGYKSLIALVSSNGTNLPTVTIIKNELGGNAPTYTRVSAGKYNINVIGGFTGSVVFCTATSSINSPLNISSGQSGGNSVAVWCRDDAGIFVDAMVETALEIRVYPEI